MTVSPKTNDRVTERRITFGPFDSDGRGRQAGTLVRERVPIEATAALDRKAELAHETRPRVGTARRSGGALRIVLGVIWLVNAYFKWQPSFLNGMSGVMHNGMAGQPGWLMPWFNFTNAVTALQPTLMAYGVAIVETGIAVALILGIARKVTYVGGALWSLLIWSTAEGFGRMSSGVATDIGAGIIYAAVFLVLLAFDGYEGTRLYSLDAVIERRLPWWRRLAEVRR